MKSLAVSLSTLALTAQAGPSRASVTWVERETYVMGTTLRITVASSTRREGALAIESAFDSVRRVDVLLSTWRDDSEIAVLNRAAPGEAVALSPALLPLLIEAVTWSDATGGAFDPAVGALIDAYDLRGTGRQPEASALAAARGATGLRRFTLDASAGSGVRRCAASWIDTGGFGKGVALRAARRALIGSGIRRGTLDFGGQVLVLGDEKGGDGAARGVSAGAETRPGWKVPIAHPSRRHEPVAELRLRDQSASTSSQSERFVVASGQRLGHILDPHTGLPVPAWGSVTVVAGDPAVADMVSTALFVLGPDAGMRWAKKRRDVAVLFLIEKDQRLEVTWNSPMAPLLVRHTLTTQGG